ncbi:MAG: hypothetical protein IT235_07330 [Bacteroidia bacterium]|nr:hypothetical protein [Bacteroidia bacterium]
MNKTVFAIWGHAQQGKSDTVKRIVQEITAAYPTATTTPSTINYSADIQVIIATGKITIGIESQGDPNSRLFTSLTQFSSANCDIIICSTRTSGATVDAVSALHASHGYDIVWTTNHRSNEKNQAILNDISAKHIFGLVQQVMAGTL